MAPNLDKVQVLCCPMVKQLESPWNLATMCSKYFQNDKQQSKVADLAKYVYLPKVGTFQVSISVTKS